MKHKETMKTEDEIKQEIKALKPMLIKKHGVKEIGIFGSYIRNEQRENSDLDVLIDFMEPPGLLELVGIENTLSDRLGAKVDLVMKSGLRSRIGDRILKEVVYI
jgi:hypothetical protein